MKVLRKIWISDSVSWEAFFNNPTIEPLEIYPARMRDTECYEIEVEIPEKRIEITESELREAMQSCGTIEGIINELFKSSWK